MGLASDEACEGQLALAVPLQKIDFGDAERLAGAAVPRNDVQSFLAKLVLMRQPAQPYFATRRRRFPDATSANCHLSNGDQI